MWVVCPKVGGWGAAGGGGGVPEVGHSVCGWLVPRLVAGAPVVVVFLRLEPSPAPPGVARTGGSRRSAVRSGAPEVLENRVRPLREVFPGESQHSVAGELRRVVSMAIASERLRRCVPSSPVDLYDESPTVEQEVDSPRGSGTPRQVRLNPRFWKASAPNEVDEQALEFALATFKRMVGPLEEIPHSCRARSSSSPERPE